MKFRRLAVALATALGIAASGLLFAAPASAATTSDFVASINNLRASKGLGTLSVDGGLSSVAQAWAQHMADAGAISHNPSLASQVKGDWRKLGENVGVGGDVASLMQAFINSPAHYQNLVDSSFNRVGVGVAVGGDGRIYTVHDFATYPGSASASPSSSPAKATATTTKKASTAPAGASSSSKGAPSSRTSRPAAPATSTTTAVPPPAAPAAEAPAAPAPAAAPALPPRILHGIVELESMAQQG